MEIALLGRTQCYPVKLFPELFIQSVHFWQADLKHDNSSGLVIHQHASGAVLFHPLVLFYTHSPMMLCTTEKWWRKCTFNTERDFLTDPYYLAAAQSRDEVHRSPLRSSPTHRAFCLHLCMTRAYCWGSSQLQKTVTTCRLCIGGITVQWKFGAQPALLKPFSCLKTNKVFTQGQLQTAGGPRRKVLFEKPQAKR